MWNAIVCNVDNIRLAHISVAQLSKHKVNDVYNPFSVFNNGVCHVGHILKNDPFGLQLFYYLYGWYDKPVARVKLWSYAFLQIVKNGSHSV